MFRAGSDLHGWYDATIYADNTFYDAMQWLSRSQMWTHVDIHENDSL